MKSVKISISNNVKFKLIKGLEAKYKNTIERFINKEICV